MRVSAAAVLPGKQMLGKETCGKRTNRQKTNTVGSSAQVNRLLCFVCLHGGRFQGLLSILHAPVPSDNCPVVSARRFITRVPH
jgi:hypothetical protein